jgi:tetratricopeptide (TPR) repeat protein
MRARLVSAVLGALVLLAGYALADEAVAKIGDREEKIKGRITKDDFEGLTVDRDAGSMTLARKDIVRDKVKYECLKRHYELGEALFRERRFDFALDKYEEAVKDERVSDQAKQYAYRRMAQCYEHMGEPAKAAESWKKLSEVAPKTCFAREMAEGMFVNYLKLGKFEEASRSLSALERLGDEGKALAQVYKAELAERKGDFGPAADSYVNVAKSVQSPETMAKAWAGAARCRLQDGKAGEAVEAAKAVLAVKGVPAVCAADAHQVMGEALLRGLPDKPTELSQEKNRERALDAIEEMMRAVVQYPGSNWAETRAYYFVGLWSERLAAAGVVGEWQNRARWANAELKKKTTNNPEAQKALEHTKK